jgi:methionyl-tRNA formyltransferase
VRTRDFLDRIEAFAPDVAVVVAFGQIFRTSLLSLPRLGCVNLHGSLLPRFRGAAPIQAAIAAGDGETGVTTMLMDEGLDTGPMLLSEGVAIGPADTTPSLADRLATVGGDLMVRTLRGLEDGSLVPRTQPGDGVLAPRLKKSDGRLRLSETASQIERRFRAYQPWPGLETICRGRALKVARVRVLDLVASSAAAPGTFLGVHDGALAVVCGQQSVLGLESVQRPGKKAVGAQDFLNGERLARGEGEFTDRLGQDER